MSIIDYPCIYKMFFYTCLEVADMDKPKEESGKRSLRTKGKRIFINEEVAESKGKATTPTISGRKKNKGEVQKARRVYESSCRKTILTIP